MPTRMLTPAATTAAAMGTAAMTPAAMTPAAMTAEGVTGRQRAGTSPGESIGWGEYLTAGLTTLGIVIALFL